MKRFVFALCLAALALPASAQTKIGYVTPDSIMVSLPEFKNQQKALQSYAQQLETQLKNSQEEFRKKYEDYQRNGDNWPQLVIEQKLKELEDLQKNLNEFQQRVQASLQQKEAELFEPLYAKMQKGIDEVAKEMGYTYVMQKQYFIYSDASHDLTTPVIRKLGGTPTPIAAAMSGAAEQPAAPAPAPKTAPATGGKTGGK